MGTMTKKRNRETREPETTEEAGVESEEETGILEPVGALSREERVQFEMITYQFLITLEAMFLQHLLGTLDASLWHARRALLERWLSGPATREAYRHNRAVLDERFNRFVDAEILPLHEPAT